MSIGERYAQFPRSSFESRFIGEELKSESFKPKAPAGRHVYSKME